MRVLLSIAVILFLAVPVGAAELYVCFDATDDQKMDATAVCVPGSVSEIEVNHLDFSMSFQSGVPGGGITTPTKSSVKPKSKTKSEKKKGKTTENPFEKVFKTSEPK